MIVGREFRHQRPFAHLPEEIFGCFSDPNLLSRWWGPAGFSNSFEVFEFRVGGRWKFVMHGPDGTSYSNESRFHEIEPSRAIAIDHISPPEFRLEVTLERQNGGTLLHWVQRFEDEKIAARLKEMVEPANEQNLDRLQQLLSRSELNRQG